jgi:hypothetical protein
MKIDQVLSEQTIKESKRSGGACSEGADAAFTQLLESEIAEQGQATAPEGSAPSGVSGMEGLSGLWGAQSPVSNSAQTPMLSQAVSALDGVLTQFDSLANALQGVKSPKEINGLIEQLNTQTASLDDKVSELPANHQLKDLVEELKVASYMESVKWNRGDYL